MASVINNITTLWPGLLIIHGSPRRPQTQGCVERGNGDLQVKLGKWLDEHGGTWSSALQYVTHAINISTSATTKATPYEVVFGQRPRKDFFVLQELANQGQLHEDHQLQLHEPSQVEDEDGQPEPDIGTAPHACTPKRLGKRGRTFELLQDHQVVATGVQQPNRLQLHGQEIDQNTHTVIEITSVIGSDLATGENNPFEEPLQVGQFVAWKLDELSEEMDMETPHRKIRKQARDNYLETARHSQIQYTNQNRQVFQDYNVGDVVGIKIHQADRTNTDAKLLPCKVLSIDSSKSTPYQLYCASGILKTRYTSVDLVSMQQVRFPALEEVDPDTLGETTVIQASRENGRWTAAPSGSVCSCKGSCITNRCRCKKAQLKCSTKCHTSVVGLCQNKF